MVRGNRAGIVFAVLITCILGGCASFEDEYDDIMGVSRTTPEGSDVNFSNRHAPVLNNVIPGGGNDNSNGRDIYSPNAVRRVPVENNMVSGDAAANTPAITTAAIASVAAPVAIVPVTTATVPASALTNPAVAASDSPYPSLATVPPVPPTTPKAQSTAELNTLTTEHDLSESGRKQLMNDQSATVMTSPQTGQLVDNADTVVAPAPATSQPVLAQSAPLAAPPAAASAPQTAKEDSGFNNWLHHIFPSDDQAPAPAASTAKQTPSENAVSTATSQPATPQAPHDLMAGPAAPVASAEPLTIAPTPEEAIAMEPVHLHPPAGATEIEQPSVQNLAAPPPAPQSLSVPSAPAIAADASVPPTPEMEPVHLHPPTSTADSEQSLNTPSVAAPEEPVTLVPPPSTSSQTHYLADSRYAARRMQALPADTDDNSN